MEELGMRHETIKIQVPGYEQNGKLYTYLQNYSASMPASEKRPLILICPGGGYYKVSGREGEPVAMQYLAMGYHAAILDYSVAPEAEYPVALLQLAGAVKYLKEHAEEYHIDPEQIFVQGFSAGAHLAANLGVFWNRDFIGETFDGPGEMFRPAGMILSYPVITSGEYAHHDSFKNLLGSRYEAMKDELSLEKQVTKDTVPAFIWHTASDNLVPVENSLLFFTALKKNGVPAELHIYPNGTHGLSLANENTDDEEHNKVEEACQSWISLAKTWLKGRCEVR